MSEYPCRRNLPSVGASRAPTRLADHTLRVVCCHAAANRRTAVLMRASRPGVGPGLACWFGVEPPGGIEPPTPSLPWNHREPLCGTPFSQVAPDRRGQSYRFSFGQVMRSHASDRSSLRLAGIIPAASGLAVAVPKPGQPSLDRRRRVAGLRASHSVLGTLVRSSLPSLVRRVAITTAVDAGSRPDARVAPARAGPASGSASGPTTPERRRWGCRRR
jgi:hypothetical protein